MIGYIARRILQMIPVFIGVTIILFILRAPGILPGDPVRMITGEKAISAELYEQIVERYGLDDPLIVQYFSYLGDLFQGDLGDSYQKGRSVIDILMREVPQHDQAGRGGHHHRDDLRHFGRESYPRSSATRSGMCS